VITGDTGMSQTLQYL